MQPNCETGTYSSDTDSACAQTDRQTDSTDTFMVVRVNNHEGDNTETHTDTKLSGKKQRATENTKHKTNKPAE